MTLTFDGQADPGTATDRSGQQDRRDQSDQTDQAALARTATLRDVVLGPAAVADLLLGLAEVLPPGQQLGGRIVDGAPPRAGWVSLTLPRRDLAAPILADGAVVLRDEEHTPLAVLEDLVPAGDAGDSISGRPRRLRQRESRTGSHPEVDFDLASLHRRPLLLMTRPATTADASLLASWAAEHEAPLVLVAEQAPRHDRVPTAALLRMAQALVADLGNDDVEIRTVPLESRDAASDLELASRIGARLQSPDVRVLLDDAPGPSAEVWSSTRDALAHTAQPDLDAFPPAVRELLGAWRPPRTQRGLVVMFTGLSGSGKSTVARDVAEWVTTHSGRTVSLLDGDRVRQMLSSGLGFDEASRELNVRRIGYVAAEVARHGGLAICSPIAPSAPTRAEVREMAEQVGDFLLVHVSTPLEECERRDLKGLYAAARAGTLAHFTGISSPYDVPTDADLAVDTSLVGRPQAARLVIDILLDGGWVKEIVR